MTQVPATDGRYWDAEARTGRSGSGDFGRAQAGETDATIRDVDATLQEIDVILRRVQSPHAGADDRARNLGLLVRLMAGWMEGLESREVAHLLRFSEQTYREVLHGARSVPRYKQRHLETVAQLLRTLLRVLERDAVGEWFRTPVPALGDRTPLDAVQRRGGDDAVLRVVESYFDTTYA